MTETPTLEEVAREIAHAGIPLCQGHMVVQEYRDGSAVGEGVPVPHAPSCDQLTATILTALTDAYERGQRDMRETDIEACRNLTLETDGETKPMPWRDVFADFLAAIPINSEKEGGAPNVDASIASKSMWDTAQ